jgi:hypothetical protein
MTSVRLGLPAVVQVVDAFIASLERSLYLSMASKERDCSAISDDSRDSFRVAPTALSRPDILRKASVLDSARANPHPTVAIAEAGCDRFEYCFRGTFAKNHHVEPARFINDLQAESYF